MLFNCLICQFLLLPLQSKKNIGIMTVAQMNTELWQNIGSIADSEPLMRRLAKYAAKLVKERKDSTLMSKEEYFAKLERAEQQIANGEGMEMLPDEDLTAFLRRNGYHV